MKPIICIHCKKELSKDETNKIPTINNGYYYCCDLCLSKKTRASDLYKSIEHHNIDLEWAMGTCDKCGAIEQVTLHKDKYRCGDCYNKYESNKDLPHVPVVRKKPITDKEDRFLFIRDCCEKNNF